jgi:hypothetical protein
MSNLPSIKKLYSADLAEIAKQDEFIVLMNQPPAPEWVKEHPYIKGHKYLPIERVEFLLKSIFKNYKIEITGQGTAFNGVWVTVRVHFVNPATGEWSYHDGIGAMQLQTAKGTSPADLQNINNGALSMAFPLAKTLAVKDACDHMGNLFGANLNRKDNIAYSIDLTLTPLDVNHPNWQKACDAVKAGKVTIEAIKKSYDLPEESENYLKTLIP